MSRVRNLNELMQIFAVDGLEFWTDGPLAGELSPRQHPGAPPELGSKQDKLLWVVRPADVVAARETCDFARDQGMNGGKIKHTNLTGGAKAHCGGEMRMLSDSCVAINASSGRYKVKDQQ